MREIHKVNQHSPTLQKFYISDEMLNELGWEKAMPLHGEITGENSFAITYREDYFRARLCAQPSYNLITFPNIVVLEGKRLARVESVNGILHVKFFKE